MKSTKGPEMIGMLALTAWLNGVFGETPAWKTVGRTRSAVHAKQGMVATSQPLAAQVGLDILKAGGNAVDAALATNAMLGLVEPMSCGVGGDLFAIVWDAKTKKLYGLNASGRAPARATLEYFKKNDLTQIPITGPLSCSTPGCVWGWEALRTRFGLLPMSKILAPAIRYANEGFPISPIIGQSWKGSESKLRQYPESAAIFLPGGAAPAIGSQWKNPALADVYRGIADTGAASFYKSKMSREIVAYLQNQGGIFSDDDWARPAADWIEPVSTAYRGYTVWELPPNGQGIAVLQMLNTLEAYDVKGLGHNSAEFAHWFVEAKKLAYEDRARFYADPDFARDMPIKTLIGKPYAERRRALLSGDRCLQEIPTSDAMIGRSDTVYLCVVDKDRNCVSLIQSLYFGWGSGVPAANHGFHLQNRGALFSLDPASANRLEPRKRPFHTIIPAMVTHEGKPWLTFGVMGGDMQPQGQTQVLINMIDHGMDPQSAGDAPRIQHVGSSTPTGDIMRDGGTVLLEPGFSPFVAESLRSKGHRVGAGQDFGGYQAILIDPIHNTLVGGSDPRKDGCAVGY